MVPFIETDLQGTSRILSHRSLRTILSSRSSSLIEIAVPGLCGTEVENYDLNMDSTPLPKAENTIK